MLKEEKGEDRKQQQEEEEMVSFNFTPTQPDEQLFTDLQKLNAFPPEMLAEFIDVLMSHLVDGTDLVAQIAAFSQNHSINEARLKNTVKALLFFLKGSMRANCTFKQVGEDLLNFGVNKDQVRIIALKYRDSFSSFSRSVIGQTLQVSFHRPPSPFPSFVLL